jgi:hypothetical protein
MNPTTNPILQGVIESAERTRLLQRHRFKLSFEAVYNWEKPLKEEIFDNIRTYCHRNSMNFMIRPFNNVMEEDREYIEKLPAIQVYYEDLWDATFYLDSDFETSLFALLAERDTPKKAWTWTWSWSLSPHRKRKRSLLTSTPQV